MKPKNQTKNSQIQKVKSPPLIRLTEMSRPIGIAESIREFRRRLARNRRKVEDDIKIKMSTAEIFNGPKAF